MERMIMDKAMSTHTFTEDFGACPNYGVTKFRAKYASY